MRTALRTNSTSCTAGNTNTRRERARNINPEKPENRIGHLVGDVESPVEERFPLPDPDDENGMGDILHGVLPDPNSDPVKEVREIRRTR